MRAITPIAVALFVSIATPAGAQLVEDTHVEGESPIPPPRPRKSTPRPPAPVLRLGPPPAMLKYDPDAPIPAGYHVRERARTGLIVAGGVVIAGGGALFALAVAASANGAVGEEVGMMGLFGGGAAALVGAPLLLTGLALPTKKVLVRDEPRVFVAPVVSSQTVGSSVAFSF